jgi:dihydrofolate reductase
MRKIILSLITSFDGFIEGPNREIDWITFDEETGKALNKFLSEIDTVLYGRVSYESWGTYTPPEDSADFEKDFYKRLHKMKKYVFSLSKNKFEGNPVVINSDINGAMERLKRESGKDIWLYGGSGLVSTFMNLDLIDEFRVAIAPVILGAGNPMFKEVNHRVKLKLLDVKPSASGVVEFHYQRIKN